MYSSRPVLRPFFEVLVLTLDGLKDLKTCSLKTSQISVLKILILDEAKLD